MEMQDYGIYLEIFGFMLLLLVSGRNPKRAVLLLNADQESGFDKIRKKIIADKFINPALIVGIAAIVLGLSFQLGFFNPN